MSWQPGKPWLNDMLQRLAELMNGEARVSYEQAANILGGEFHAELTRNSVAGAWLRIRRAEGRPIAKRTRKIINLVDPAPIPPPPSPPKQIKQGHVRLIDLEHDQCHYTAGGGDYCGAPVAVKSYCREHAERMYAPRRALR